MAEQQQTNIISPLPAIAAPAASANAGVQFEERVAAFYLLSLLNEGEPRGLPGATVKSIELQQLKSGRPLDDIVVRALNSDGSESFLEIQAKRSLTFTKADVEFADIVLRVWHASRKPEFASSRYELAVAIARTTTRIETACQEVLHWARHTQSANEFNANIEREGFSNKAMRDFVAIFRENLGLAGAPTDDNTVWLLLRRFQILVFDFESAGSDYEHRARERAKLALDQSNAVRAASLWSVLIDEVSAYARAGGSIQRSALVDRLKAKHGFIFVGPPSLTEVLARISSASSDALDQITDEVGGVRLSRTVMVESAYRALEKTRFLKIHGAAGVGKSVVMKILAERLRPEGTVFVLSPARITPGGWTALGHTLECPVSREVLFNELGANGGATLFIDNIDQIEDDAKWSTVADLLSTAASCPGWVVVATTGTTNDDWQARLPREVKSLSSSVIDVGLISDDEARALSEQNVRLAALLNATHPAKNIARNLFYLSRMVELNAGIVGSVASEVDLAQLWWGFGGGRGGDDRRFARLKVLRTIAQQTVQEPARLTYKADDFDATTLAELIRLNTLREEIKGATVSFRHDVLRDWAIGFLIGDDPTVLQAANKTHSLSVTIARGLEIAARIALARDEKGKQWAVLLNIVENPTAHGSWQRPILLALPRSERAAEHLSQLQPLLLENGGKRLIQIIKLMLAVETVPLALIVSIVQPEFKIPAGTEDIVVPRGRAWFSLIAWIIARSSNLPTETIPTIAKVFQAWLVAMQSLTLTANAQIVGLLFDWLTLLEGSMSYRRFDSDKESPKPLNIPHLREVRDDIRMTAFSFASINPEAAQRYIAGLDPKEVRHDDMHYILRAPASLIAAAPTQIIDFSIASLLPLEDDEDSFGGHTHRYGPFDIHEHAFSPASPGQGPFFEALEASTMEGLRFVRAIVERATEWREEMYRAEHQTFPMVAVECAEGTRTFRGDFTIFMTARTSISPLATSALMALEAWAHRQIESGRDFPSVLVDVLGPDGSSVAFLQVGIDLALSHWPLSRGVAWRALAVPNIIWWDTERYRRDLAGVNRLTEFESENKNWQAKRADLDSKDSRRLRLIDIFPRYVFNAKGTLALIKSALERANAELAVNGISDQDPIDGLRATAARALRMTDPANWPERTIQGQDGKQISVYQYQPTPEEIRIQEEKSARAEANLRDMNIRIKIENAFFDAKQSTPEIVADGIKWARELPSAPALPSTNHDDEEDDSDRRFQKDWDKRAQIMAAALAVRELSDEGATDDLHWATVVLENAALSTKEEYRGNKQVQYNTTAIAAIGLCNLYIKRQDTKHRDALLRLMTSPMLAVLTAITSKFPELTRIEPKIAPAMARVVMASSVHPHRRDTQASETEGIKKYEAKVAAAVASEQAWLDGFSNEPSWPALPRWHTRIRRRARIIPSAVESIEHRELPDEYLDEHALGALITALTQFTIGGAPQWLIDLGEYLFQWTSYANGSRNGNDSDSDHRPFEWNAHFFGFLGVLAVALPSDTALEKFIHPLINFRDEAFYDAAAYFLRGFDNATLATDTPNPENPKAIRSAIADRIKSGWNYKRIGREKGSNTSETHAGDALNAIFYQSHRIANMGVANIPKNWEGLTETIEILTSLVVGAPASGYLAGLFLNLMETNINPHYALSITSATKAWAAVYGTDSNFWVEKGFGTRLCVWLQRLLDGHGLPALASEKSDLTVCLDVLIRAGVPLARDIEERLERGKSPL